MRIIKEAKKDRSLLNRPLGMHKDSCCGGRG